MTAVSLRTEGLQRIGTGFSLFCQAMIDSMRSLYLMLSGLALLFTGLLVMPLVLISLSLTSLVRKAKPDGPMWSWVRFPLRSIPGGVVRWGVRGMVAMLAFAAVCAAAVGLDLTLRTAPIDIGVVLYPLALFAALGVVVPVVVLALRLLATLLAPIGWFLSRNSARVLLGVFVFVLVCGGGATLCAVAPPSFVIALVVCLALIAGLAGVAIISFGPSMFSVFRLGGWGGAASGSASVAGRPSPAATWHQRAQPSQGQLRPAIGSRAARVAPALLAPADGPTAPPDESSRASGSWLAGRAGFRRRWITIALLALLALLLAWFGGELLLRAFSDNVQPGISANKQAPPRSATSVVEPPRAVGPQAIQLLADGVPTDVSWRSGYRNMMARLDDGGAVRALALPQSACDAVAIVVFGSASSDGNAARNDALALRRARWLADWTWSQLVQCPGRAPTVVALSLGQARSEPPRPAQRGVRLMAIREEDLAGLANTNDPVAKLRDMAGVVFGDLADFERFEGCTLQPPGVTVVIQGLPQGCETADR